MKIVVATIGSRGDVQPYIYLCQGLREAGHEVVLATNPTLCPLADSHGVAAVPVGPAVDMGAVGARLLDQSFNNMWIGMIRVMQFGAQLVEAAYPETLAVCRGADVVITSDTGSGIAEAERLEIPWVSVTLQPARVPLISAAPSFLARTLWSVMGRLFVAPTNRFRRRVGAPPVQDMASMMSTRLVLLPVSQHVASPDTRWPRHVHQTGYWFSRSDEAWEPPQGLLEFLEGGDTPLAVSLGVMGMSGRRAQEAAQIILAALERTEVRAIVQGWDDALRGLADPRRVYFAGALPHHWLFDRVSMVIHHGGFGTTAATLRAGVPGLVVPHVIDQFYWAQRVMELGVSPGFISRGRLRVGNLSEAIQRVGQDEPMRERASKLGRKIRAEGDGVTAAVRVLEGTA